MRFIDGLRTLVLDKQYNYGFFLSILSTVIIALWLALIGEVSPVAITDPVQGTAISIVVSFEYFMIVLVILSLISSGREKFFRSEKSSLYQIILSLVIIVVFMFLRGDTVLVGVYVGIALAFIDTFITSYFAILLAWNIAKSVSLKITNSRISWALFVIFLFMAVTMFGVAYIMFGLGLLPFEHQIVLLMFPLLVILLPLITIFFRDSATGPRQTPVLAIILLGMGFFYTFRLVNITEPTWTQVDLLISIIFLIYGLATTVISVQKSTSANPVVTLTLILLVLLSRVGSQVNRLLAYMIGMGDMLQLGLTSFIIINLAVFGLLIPAYWLKQERKRVGEDL